MSAGLISIDTFLRIGSTATDAVLVWMRPIFSVTRAHFEHDLVGRLFLRDIGSQNLLHLSEEGLLLLGERLQLIGCELGHARVARGHRLGLGLFLVEVSVVGREVGRLWVVFVFSEV